MFLGSLGASSALHSCEASARVEFCRYKAARAASKWGNLVGSGENPAYYLSKRPQSVGRPFFGV